MNTATNSQQTQARKAFSRNGFVHLKRVLKARELNHFAAHLRPLMAELNPNQLPLEKRSTYRRAFTQVTNLWQRSATVKDFVFRQDLARLAAGIMGVQGVRLYHDQALFKEAGGGATPWHVDQVYWPMDTDNTCTFWIPLQETPREMGTLSFATGSQLHSQGRDLVISDTSEAYFSKWVREAGFEVTEEDFDLGDISVHAGWTVHHAGPNHSDRQRMVMTIIYMAEDARLKTDLSATQQVDRDAFTPGIEPGQLLNSALNPLLYSARQSK